MEIEMEFHASQFLKFRRIIFNLVLRGELTPKDVLALVLKIHFFGNMYKSGKIFFNGSFKCKNYRAGIYKKILIQGRVVFL